MPKRPIENKDLVKLLSILKEETPEYPELVEARKRSFLKQASEFNVSRGDQGGGTSGDGGSSGTSGLSGSSGSGATSSGGVATIGFGISLKSALTFGAIILLLTGTYVFREKIVSYLDENNIINIEESTTEPVPSFEDNNAPGFDNIDDGSNANPETLKPETIQVTPKPTNSEQNGPISGFKHLICVLRYGGENCK